MKQPNTKVMEAIASMHGPVLMRYSAAIMAVDAAQTERHNAENAHRLETKESRRRIARYIQARISRVCSCDVRIEHILDFQDAAISSKPWLRITAHPQIEHAHMQIELTACPRSIHQLDVAIEELRTAIEAACNLAAGHRAKESSHV